MIDRGDTDRNRQDAFRALLRGDSISLQGRLVGRRGGVKKQKKTKAWLSWSAGRRLYCRFSDAGVGFLRDANRAPPRADIA